MNKYQSTYYYLPAVAHEPQQNPKEYENFSVVPMSGAMGAEVVGLDLANITDNAETELKAALTDHLMLFARKQSLSPKSFRDFARRFGEPICAPTSFGMSEYPEISNFRAEADTVYNFGSSWHGDSLAQECPPKFTILNSIISPPVGGDTTFSNQYLAWDTLPTWLRDEVEYKKAVYSNSLSYTGIPKPGTKKSGVYKSADSKEWEKESVHPVVWTHPVTRRKALIVCSSFTAHFVGQSQEQSLPTLRKLIEHSTFPDFTCRLKWEKDTLAIWDNRCTIHAPHNDHYGYVREMRRIMIKGDRPV